jgi:hypothetical protein
VAKSDDVLMPDADLFESMRAVGYSLKTALADLCDNSITAEARNVWINWSSAPSPHITVLDDGIGMSKQDLRIAMKLAGKSPRQNRSLKDLGRFGLGLKTASLSQARQLIVISKTTDGIVAACWDLDYVLSTQAWTLQWLDGDAYQNLPGFNQLSQLKTGTLVIWQNLDLLLGDSSSSPEFLMNEMVEAVKHLSLVFHRFIDGTPADRVAFFANDQKLNAIDPFLVGPKGSLSKGENYVRVGSSQVVVKAYILPSLSKMSAAQQKHALFAGGMREAQGFYIYRNKRLLTFGTWFKLAPRSENAKLARVQVDTTNELDAEWRLGIMKSSVKPPESLRTVLVKLIPTIIQDSRIVAEGRGRKITESSTSTWVMLEKGGGNFSLEINREHPLIQALSDSLTSESARRMNSIFTMLENQFPADIVHSRLSRDNLYLPSEDQKSFHLELATQLFSVLRPSALDDAQAWVKVLSIEPFASSSEARAQIDELISK